MTGREHLELYARVKGLSEQEVEEVVNKKIKEMDLTEFANRNASTYSGGNKRKVWLSDAFLERRTSTLNPMRSFLWLSVSCLCYAFLFVLFVYSYLWLWQWWGSLSSSSLMVSQVNSTVSLSFK